MSLSYGTGRFLLVGDDFQQYRAHLAVNLVAGFLPRCLVFMSALYGIDIAPWDLKAWKPDVPIYQLLGDRVRVKIMVYVWISGGKPSDVVAQANARNEQGFTAVKRKRSIARFACGTEFCGGQAEDRQSCWTGRGSGFPRLNPQTNRETARKLLEPYGRLIVGESVLPSTRRVRRNFHYLRSHRLPSGREDTAVGIVEGTSSAF